MYSIRKRCLKTKKNLTYVDITQKRIDIVFQRITPEIKVQITHTNIIYHHTQH